MGSPGERCCRSGGAPSSWLSGLSGDAALTIHLKMTGQLFVVPADRPEDPYVRLVLELATVASCGFGISGSSGRSACTGGTRQRRAGGGAGGARSLPGSVPNRSIRSSRCGTSGNAIRRREGPAQAAAHRPVVPRGRREHLRRRGAVAGASPPAPLRESLRPPTSATCTRRSAGPGRGGGAARLLDRRLHGARW